MTNYYGCSHNLCLDSTIYQNNPKAILKMSCDGIRNPACCFPKRRLLSCLWLWHRKKDVISRNSAYQTKGAAKSHFWQSVQPPAVCNCALLRALMVGITPCSSKTLSRIIIYISVRAFSFAIVQWDRQIHCRSPPPALTAFKNLLSI